MTTIVLTGQGEDESRKEEDAQEGDWSDRAEREVSSAVELAVRSPSRPHAVCICRPSVGRYSQKTSRSPTTDPTAENPIVGTSTILSAVASKDGAGDSMGPTDWGKRKQG